MVYDRLKARTFDILQGNRSSGRAGKAFAALIIALIVLSVVSMMLETFNGLPPAMVTVIGIFDVISVSVFSIEYLLRVWTGDLLFPKTSRFKGKLCYIFSLMALIDLLAVLPFYIPFIIPMDLRVLRTFRLLRILRVFKLNRYSQALAIIGRVLKNRSSQVDFDPFRSYSADYHICGFDVQHRERRTTGKIPKHFLRLLVVHRNRDHGRLRRHFPRDLRRKGIASLIGFCGIALVAIPTGIISAGFTEISRVEAQRKAEASIQQEQNTNAADRTP
jgi:voltage-gated potassium channel